MTEVIKNKVPINYESDNYNRRTKLLHNSLKFFIELRLKNGFTGSC